MKKLKILTLISSLFPLMGISAGQVAPDFSVKNQNGKIIKLSDFKGKVVILYFYPKDETPGCTKEACSFRDQYVKLKELGTVVLGVSKQDEKSHLAFIKNHKLPFDLLVDDGTISKAYGINDMPLVGILKRQSVLIDRNGKVAKFYDKVDPDTHVEEVLKDIESLPK